MMCEEAGIVVWITGLSAAGKTTIGRLAYKQLRKREPSTTFLDGDLVRQILGNDLGHSLEDRVKNAFRLAKLCQYLSSEGHHVICSTMSLYPEVWDWNRKNILRYREVYVRVDKSTLIERDPKGLYARAEKGLEKNVVGFDLPFHEPVNADLVIDNNVADMQQEKAELILESFFPE